MSVEVPHLDFPFRIGAGGVAAVVEQDSDEDVVNCVRVLLGTRKGQRSELPEYGIDDPLFTQDPDLSAILDDIEDWEPRAAVTLTDDIDSVDELIRHIGAGVQNGGDVE